MLQHFFISIALICVSNQRALAYNDSSRLEHKPKIDHFYGGFFVGGGHNTTGFGGELAVFKGNNWGLAANFITTLYVPPNKPADYKPATGLFMNMFGDPIHNDIARTSSVMLVKQFPTSLRRLHFNVAAGPSVAHHTILQFTSIPEERGSGYTFFSWYSGNYKVDTAKRWSIGLSLKSSVAFTFSKIFCMQLAAFANLNTQHSDAGLQLEFLFGKLRRQK